jgi:hypothetical protein
MTERKAKRMLEKIRKLTPSDPLPLPLFALLVSQSMTMAGRIRSGDAVLEIFFNMLQGHDPMIRGLKSPPNHWFVRAIICEIMADCVHLNDVWKEGHGFSVPPLALLFLRVMLPHLSTSSH